LKESFFQPEKRNKSSTHNCSISGLTFTTSFDFPGVDFDFGKQLGQAFGFPMFGSTVSSGGGESCDRIILLEERISNMIGTNVGRFAGKVIALPFVGSETQYLFGSENPNCPEAT
jgi:hypothetical protein